MRGQALLFAVPLSGAAVAFLELTRLPAAGLGPGRGLAAFSELVRSAIPTFAGPALLLVAASVAVLAHARTRGARRPRLEAALAVALFGIGAGQVALARETLIAYAPFAWSHAVTAALVALGVLAGLAHVALLFEGRRVTALGVLLGIGSLVAARAHYVVYVGLYPTLHQFVLQLCFVGCALGAGLALGGLERPRVVPRLGLGLAAALVGFCLVELPGAAWARPVVSAYTELGRIASVAAALERDAAHLFPEDLPGPRRSRLLAPDDDALARFARRSGLPPLDVDLADRDVLLVLLDATRFDRTSLADPSRGTTPRLAALEAQGAFVFERAYAPSNGTFPSLAAMLSMRPLSLAPVDIEDRWWRGTLRADPARPTVAEAYAAAGRDTFWVGHDHERCFSRNIRGLERGFAERVLIEQMRGDPAGHDADARIADAAIARIRRARSPWFGLVFFVSPHDEYVGGYDAELRRADAALSRLLEAVDLERTVVVVAGDHGEAFGEHGHTYHLSSLYDEQIRVPLAVWVPGAAGERRAAPTSTGYVLPWLMLRGAPREREAAEGALVEDVGPMMRALDGAVLSELLGRRKQQAALIWEDTTMVYDVFADLPRLFDARRDPAQRRDLREDDPPRFARALPFVRRYRRARFEGRRFRFVREAQR